MNNRSQRIQDTNRSNNGSLSCGESMAYDPLQTMPLAMAYIPWQQWQNVYEGSKGLENGTIFEELIFPFNRASSVCSNGNCRQSTDYSYRGNSRRSMNGNRYSSERYDNEKDSRSRNENYNTERVSRYGNERCNNERTSRCERRCD